MLINVCRRLYHPRRFFRTIQQRISADMSTEELRPLSSWWGGGTSSPENKKQDEREQHNKIVALESEMMAMKKEHDEEIMMLRKIHADEVTTLKATIKTLETLLDQRAPTMSVVPPPLPYSLPPPNSSPQSTVPVFLTAAPPRPRPQPPTTPATTNSNPNQSSPLASFLTSLISTSNSSSSDPITEFLDKQRIKDIQVHQVPPLLIKDVIVPRSYALLRISMSLL